MSFSGDGTITGLVAGGLPDSVIVTNDIVNAAVTTAKLGANSVTTNEIVNGAVTTAKLAANSVTTNEIVNGAVTITKLGTNEASGLCKAWVNFNGTAAGTFAGGASTVTRVAGSTTATVTTTSNHGLITGNTVYALTGVVAGIYTVTVLTSTTFTITTVATTALTNASITFAVNSIRASYNVSSITDNGVGDYTVNFTTALADANYAVVCTQADGRNDASLPYMFGLTPGTYNRTVSILAGSVRLYSASTSAATYDALYNYVAIFR
jgi:hypothetical protein